VASSKGDGDPDASRIVFDNILHCQTWSSTSERMRLLDVRGMLLVGGSYVWLVYR
jgi:hypothetical protein